MGTHRSKPHPKPRRLNIVGQLRKVMRDSGESEYAIAQAAGVPQSVVNRFARGERGISLETAARLCAYLRLELVRRP